MERNEVFDRAAEILRSEGYEASVQEDYSGRGMSGRTTPAIVTDAGGVRVGWAIATAAAYVLDMKGDDMDSVIDALETQMDDLLPGRSDNMGRDAMVYY